MRPTEADGDDSATEWVRSPRAVGFALVHPKRKENPQARCPRVRSKDLSELIAAAWAAGWWCETKKKGHVMCYSPDGDKMVLVAGTPSDHHTVDNTRSTFRRAGLNV
jgi:hypothetical protein